MTMKTYKCAECECERLCESDTTDQSEEMTFAEAALKMEAGDVFKSDEPNSDIECYAQSGGLEFYRWDDEEGGDVIYTKKNLTVTGRIIPAKPKVESAEEIVRNVYAASLGIPRRVRSEININLVEAGKTNGRLEMYRELEPLVERQKQTIRQAIELLKRKNPNTCGYVLSEALDELENLPKP